MPLEPDLKLEQISPKELNRLLSLVGAAQGFIQHDLVGDRGLFRLYCKYLNEISTRKEELDLAKLHSTVTEVSTRLDRILRVLDRLMLDGSVAWSLMSSPSAIAQFVAEDLGQELRILSPADPPLQILFPSNALYAVIRELARNAVAHSSNSPIALEWAMQPERFLLSIHDAGTGLKDVLTDRHLALDLLQPQLFKRGGGLSIVRRIAHCAGGLLLARRSPVLGGAEISVHLPVTAYSLGESDL